MTAMHPHLNDPYEKREDELYGMTPSALKRILREKGTVKFPDAIGAFQPDIEWLVRTIMRIEFPLGM